MVVWSSGSKLSSPLAGRMTVTAPVPHTSLGASLLNPMLPADGVHGRHPLSEGVAKESPWLIPDISAFVVGSWWSSSLWLHVPMFYSQWYLLQQSTLPSSSSFQSGCFVAIVISVADTWPSLVPLADTLSPLSLASSLVDAFFPSVSWSFPLQMLCRSKRLRYFPGGCLAAGGIPGGCFAAVAALGEFCATMALPCL